MLAVPGRVRQGCGRSRLRRRGEQSGAAEACWAHNPEVDGSKPSSAKSFLFLLLTTADSPLHLTASYTCTAALLLPGRSTATALPLPQPLLSDTATFSFAFLAASTPKVTLSKAGWGGCGAAGRAQHRAPPARQWVSWGHRRFSLPIRQLNPQLPSHKGGPPGLCGQGGGQAWYSFGKHQCD